MRRSSRSPRRTSTTPCGSPTRRSAGMQCRGCPTGRASWRQHARWIRSLRTPFACGSLDIGLVARELDELVLVDQTLAAQRPGLVVQRCSLALQPLAQHLWPALERVVLQVIAKFAIEDDKLADRSALAVNRLEKSLDDDHGERADQAACDRGLLCRRGHPGQPAGR